MKTTYQTPRLTTFVVDARHLFAASITPEGSTHGLYMDSSTSASSDEEARVKTNTVEWEKWD